MATTRKKDVTRNVYEILENNPETRSNDNLLLITYWSSYDNLTFDATFPIMFPERATSAESITRSRRSIQGEGLFLPDEQVQRSRNRQMSEYQAAYASNESTQTSLFETV